MYYQTAIRWLDCYNCGKEAIPPYSCVEVGFFEVGNNGIVKDSFPPMKLIEDDVVWNVHKVWNPAPYRSRQFAFTGSAHIPAGQYGKITFDFPARVMMKESQKRPSLYLGMPLGPIADEWHLEHVDEYFVFHGYDPTDEWFPKNPEKESSWKGVDARKLHRVFVQPRSTFRATPAQISGRHVRDPVDSRYGPYSRNAYESLLPLYDVVFSVSSAYGATKPGGQPYWYHAGMPPFLYDITPTGQVRMNKTGVYSITIDLSVWATQGHGTTYEIWLDHPDTYGPFNGGGHARCVQVDAYSPTIIHDAAEPYPLQQTLVARGISNVSIHGTAYLPVLISSSGKSLGYTEGISVYATTKLQVESFHMKIELVAPWGTTASFEQPSGLMPI